MLQLFVYFLERGVNPHFKIQNKCKLYSYTVHTTSTYSVVHHEPFFVAKVG